MAHLGSAHAEAELGLLLEQGRGMLADVGQDEFDLGFEPARPKSALVTGPAAGGELFKDVSVPGERVRVGAPLVLTTSSALLFEALAKVYDDLGFGTVSDTTFRDLVIAWIVEPTSILDTGRVLNDLGQQPANEPAMRGTLARVQQRDYRDRVLVKMGRHHGLT